MAKVHEGLAGNLSDADLLETTQDLMHEFCMGGGDVFEYEFIEDCIREAIGEAAFNGYGKTCWDFIDAEMSRSDCMRVLAIVAWGSGRTEEPPAEVKTIRDNWRRAGKD